MRCNVAGEKPINIIWYHNGKVVKTQNSTRLEITRDGKLNFHKTRASDVGTYYCRASNKFGSVVSRTATLTSAGKMSIPFSESIIED